MEITYEKQSEDIKDPVQATFNDSGNDLFLPKGFDLLPGERKTVSLGIKFAIEVDSENALIKVFGMGVEMQIRPKSGLSKKGIDVELGTIDEGYRGFCGVTVTNTTPSRVSLETGQKICQIVTVPVFNRVKLVSGKVNEDTERGAGGFGSTGLK